MGLTPAQERRILKTFRRATLSSTWWEKKERLIRFCLKCGESLAKRFVPEEGRNRLVCVGCGFVAYQNPVVVAATLPVRNGKIYLLRRDIEPARGLWTFPAGYMEMGESAEEAAIRETREEIRTRVRLEGLQNIYSYADAGVVTVVYGARVLGPEPRAGAEAQEVKAFAPKEIPWRELAFRSTFHALKDWIHSLNGFGRIRAKRS